MSEPHTSVTALHTDMCMVVGLFRPTAYYKFQMRAFKYFKLYAPEIQLTTFLVHACVATVATLTGSRESRTLLLFVVCVP